MLAKPWFKLFRQLTQQAYKTEYKVFKSVQQLTLYVWNLLLINNVYFLRDYFKLLIPEIYYQSNFVAEKKRGCGWGCFRL